MQSVIDQTNQPYPPLLIAKFFGIRNLLQKAKARCMLYPSKYAILHSLVIGLTTQCDGVVQIS